MSKVFLDTSYAIALAIEKDQYHQQALTLANAFEQQGQEVLTTWAVVIEIGNALASASYRKTGVAYINALRADPQVEIVPSSSLTLEAAYALYESRPDKEWGLTDCISFVVMQEHGVTDALTADRHFEQAGFTALLRST
jgi:hypothetical protein